MACKSVLFSRSMPCVGDYRDATLYLRNARVNDTNYTYADLKYPLSIKVILNQQFTIGSDEPHQMSGVVEVGGYTHTALLWKSVNLEMLSYNNPTTSINQKRNILVFRDFTNISYPNGVDNVYKIINPDITESLARPTFNKLYLKWQGILSQEGSLSY